MTHPCLCDICLSARDAELQRVRVDLERLQGIEMAARALWDAHNKSHDAIQHPARGIDPRKYGMNYGELVSLGRALGIVPKERVMIIETIQVTYIDGSGWVVQGDDGRGHVRASVKSYKTEAEATEAYRHNKVQWEE